MTKITGAKAIKLRFGRLTGPDTVRQIGAALYAGGQIIENEMARSITEGSVSGKGHVVSFPGEPPNSDTHVLDRSIETVLVTPLRVEVSVNAPYARPLNYGTSKMAARPFAEPAVARKRKEVVALARAAARKIAVGGKVIP